MFFSEIANYQSLQNVNRNFQEMHKKRYTIAGNTFATNPGNVQLNPLVWIKYHVLSTAIRYSWVGMSIWLTFSVSLWFSPILLMLIGVNILYWRRKREHFRLGDSNGGIVIDTNPKLVAVTTDLTKGMGAYPVVKIIRYRGKGELGDRIGTVALYRGSSAGDVPHWNNFFPIPIEYATRNPAVLDRALQSYPPDQWDQIAERLLQVPKPYTPGLYYIKGDSSNWKA